MKNSRKPFNVHGAREGPRLQGWFDPPKAHGPPGGEDEEDSAVRNRRDVRRRIDRNTGFPAELFTWCDGGLKYAA